MLDFGERIKIFRKHFNLTQQELADTIGANNKQTISDIEKGKQKSFKDDQVRIILDKFGISKAWLILGDGEMFQQRASVSQNATGNGINQVSGSGNIFKHSEKGITSTGDQSKERMINIPFLHNVYASAGGGAVVPASDYPTVMSFSESFLKDFFRLDTFKGLHIITATGNSMEPKIYAGELLFINPYENENSSIVEGAIYVVLSSGHIYVKRIYPNGKELRLVSDNEKVSDIVLMGDEIDEMKIIGRVVGHFDTL